METEDTFFFFTWTGCRLHVVMLLVPLHGTMVTQHHLPQRFAEVCQAGDVAVQGDMLPVEKRWKYSHPHSLLIIFVNYVSWDAQKRTRESQKWEANKPKPALFQVSGN